MQQFYAQNNYLPEGFEFLKIYLIFCSSSHKKIIQSKYKFFLEQLFIFNQKHIKRLPIQEHQTFLQFLPKLQKVFLLDCFEQLSLFFFSIAFFISVRSSGGNLYQQGIRRPIITFSFKPLNKSFFTVNCSFSKNSCSFLE